MEKVFDTVIIGAGPSGIGAAIALKKAGYDIALIEKSDADTFFGKHIKKEDIPAAFIKYYPSYMNGTMNVLELARLCELSRCFY